MSSADDRAARRLAWTGGVARSFAEAEEQDLEFWMKATPAERIRGVTQLIDEMLVMSGEGGPPPDFGDLLEAFDHAAVEALIVGGYAVAFHGRPRATKDIDLLLAGSEENLARAASALERFGVPRHLADAVRTMQPQESERRRARRISSTPRSSSA
jgi:hypothetical protein